MNDQFTLVSPEEPFLFETSAGVFGTQDKPVDFSYGGTSDLPSGDVNPEDFAAFPKDMFEDGTIKPGQPMSVINPATRKKVVVIARHAKTDNETGMDLAPHSLLELGSNPQSKYILDVRPVKGYPAASYPVTPPKSQMQQGAEEIPDAPGTASTNPALDSAGDSTGQGLSDVSMDGGNEGGDAPDAGGASQKQADGIKSRNKDGSITYNDGITLYPDGQWERPIAGGAKTEIFTPGAKTPRIIENKHNGGDDEMFKAAEKKGWSASDYDMTTPEGLAEAKKSAQRVLGYYPPNTDAGDAALANETPSMKARIQAIVEGRTQPPPMSRNNPINNHIWDLIYAKDPNYSPQSFTNYKNFTTGKDAESLASMDAALEHLANLKDTVDKLNPSKYKGFNTIGNFMKSNTDDPELQRLKTDITALSAQLAGFYKGQGRAATDPEMQNWENKVFSASMGPQQFKASIDETLKLMEGQYNSIKNKFLRATGQDDTNFQFVKPSTQKLLHQKFGIDGFGYGGGDSSTAPSPSTPAPAIWDVKPGGMIRDKVTGKAFRLKPGGNPRRREDYEPAS